MKDRVTKPWLLYATFSLSSQASMSIYPLWFNCSHHLLCFEKTRLSPQRIQEKALEEADIWFRFSASGDGETNITSVGLASPPPGLTKCNVASSWSETLHLSGAAWILREHGGDTVCHSRRAQFFFFFFELLVCLSFWCGVWCKPL